MVGAPEDRWLTLAVHAWLNSSVGLNLLVVVEEAHREQTVDEDECVPQSV